MTYVEESEVEEFCLACFRDLGYQVQAGSDVKTGSSAAERESISDGVLTGRLRQAIARLNPDLPPRVVDDVAAALRRVETQNILSENARFHEILTRGYEVEYRDNRTGETLSDVVTVVDFEDPDNNDFVAVNQFTILEGRHHRRADVVVFLNGLPIAVFELKNPGDERGTLKAAWQQLRTYAVEMPSLFMHNGVLVVSDGVSACLGALDGRWEHFSPWKTIGNSQPIEDERWQLEVLTRGVFDKARLLDLLRFFVVFSDDRSGLTKRIAKYHQYWAVNAAVASTVQASREGKDGRAGVVWHTQGSGKSLEMLFYARKIVRHPQMNNPTLVLLTDRNDLDNQLFDEVFTAAQNVPETPVQAASRDHLRELLQRASGGIVFTTIHKFSLTDEERATGGNFPLLSARHNVVVIADEAHRSQYGFIDGFARHLRDALPNATYIGFTGTPIELDDRSTRQVFGDYVSVYDVTQAVQDGATVKIYYESRLAKVTVDVASEIDAKFDAITETETERTREQLKSRWSSQKRLIGAPGRIKAVANDIVRHWSHRVNALEGKGMIVCASRDICVAMYEQIIQLRPSWRGSDDTSGKIKVVISGSAADGPDLQPHIRTKEQQRELKERAKDPQDPLALVIVCDMWLTGFDSPSMHTMYIDKPMQGHTLMQAIARVNRTWRDKPAGLVVDYIGIADELRRALTAYSKQDREATGVPLDVAVRIMTEKHEVVTAILHDVDWTNAFSEDPELRATTYKRVLDFLLGHEDRRRRFLDESLALQKAFALAVPDERALSLRDQVGFFQSVRGQIRKLERTGGAGGDSTAELDTAIRQILSEALAADGVVDIYEQAGLDKPELSVLSDEFLDSMSHAEHPNLQLEALRKILNDEIRSVSSVNVVQKRRFSEMLETAVRKYQNRALTTAEAIAELVDLAKTMKSASRRGEALGLDPDELAFYDALVQNEPAVDKLGENELRKMAEALVQEVRSNATIDWAEKESVRARMRAKVRRMLLRNGYPLDRANATTNLVIDQAELFAERWATSDDA